MHYNKFESGYVPIGHEDTQLIPLKNPDTQLKQEVEDKQLEQGRLQI